MTSFVVLSANSKCGAITIQAKTPDDAALLYSESCGADSERIWVWSKKDYHNEPSLRPNPHEYDLKELVMAGKQL